MYTDVPGRLVNGGINLLLPPIFPNPGASSLIYEMKKKMKKKDRGEKAGRKTKRKRERKML